MPLAGPVKPSASRQFYYNDQNLPKSISKPIHPATMIKLDEMAKMRRRLSE
jgi:hypothetical protein